MEWAPYQPDTMFITPFHGEGFTTSGIFLGFDERLPRVLGRTLTRGSNNSIDVGMVVLFRPHTFEEIEDSRGTKLFVISEKAVHGILEGYDEETPNVKELYL